MFRRLAPFLLLLACQDDPGLDGPLKTPPQKPAAGAPERVTYDHILIAFAGSYERVKVYRSKDEARQLAYDLLERIKSGANFEALKQEYSDDKDPNTGVVLGPYRTRNHGVKRKRLDEIPRRNFHPLLGYLLFRLKVHEVAMADWHAKDCPDGWHILKRLE